MAAELNSLTLLGQLDISGLTSYLATFIYIVLGLIALWGAFCVVMVWMRVARQRFRNEEEQSAFLAELQAPLASGNYEAAADLCDGDPRALSQLALVEDDILLSIWGGDGAIKRQYLPATYT